MLENGGMLYTLDSKYLHDFYQVLYTSVVHMVNTLQSSECKAGARKKLINALIKAMLSYNLDTSDAVGQLDRLLNALQEQLAKGVLRHPHTLKRLNQSISLGKMLSLCSEASIVERHPDITKIMEQIAQRHVESASATDYRLQWSHFEMASAMMAEERYVRLYKYAISPAASDNFFAPSMAEEARIDEKQFIVGVYAHHHPIGVLGAGVKGVCIGLDSSHRKEHLHPAFMNLCVHDGQKVFLWGLLCRATGEDENVYILNNLQGSVNNRQISRYDVRQAIIDALRRFVRKNRIDRVLVKDQNFNAISLAAGLTEIHVQKKRYILEKTTRLDFSVTEKGVVTEETLYTIA